ncbi:MAG: hypothetical protein COW19_04905 [Zetaproteobacteria bacterium CG12_big_fil_rev_8_21_14_0_65_55_1124]|nr:MAG: hypothetical protein COT53_10985 [Zetaproteobacteria bacterium CG08_land_8_20_14_0_20_55_17]PIW43060.1 MAG: hypothetical protein COW19_04905 [Zetaproteobacteria bacterium CG12_big_fil_rev_8_21_14_0_65_55_1124]PIY51344.1 MAG: hypothetical protein COZ01_11450 [Zetaproteobacteria bacterium CG_4_10_14_0_8_um_filter_55_43]PIZ37986.1 MAG: hypothetical protein COY36_07655 [Zetaproteobacteria bacterium CG_4_10_14_0_2_um_filter_55_20]PJB81885.1 MAG: hypothetical protein CO089_02985 [Zetaproteoba
MKDAQEVWETHFSLDKQKTKHPIDVIFDVINSRPRDLIVFVTRLFETAYNHGRDKVTQEDFNDTLEIYSSIANQNIIAEIKAEFPYVEDLFVDLQRYRSSAIRYKDFVAILKKKGIPEPEHEALIETLFLKGYLLGYNHSSNLPITDLQTLLANLEPQTFWQRWVSKPKVLIYPHAKSYYLDSKKRARF